MPEIRFPVDVDEYWEILRRKGSKSHKSVYMDGLGLDYTPPKLGRPTAFDAAAYEEKAREDYLQRLAEYNAKHAADYEVNKKALGIDTEKGTVSGFTLKNQLKRRE